MIVLQDPAVLLAEAQDALRELGCSDELPPRATSNDARALATTLRCYRAKELERWEPGPDPWPEITRAIVALEALAHTVNAVMNLAHERGMPRP